MFLGNFFENSICFACSFLSLELVKYSDGRAQNGCNDSYTYQETTAVSPTPKYLEILYDERDNAPVMCRPYEIPLTGPILESDANAANYNHHDDLTPTASIDLELKNKTNSEKNISNLNNNNKERTFSSSSTVSDSSLCYPYTERPSPPPLADTHATNALNQNIILTVTLPNAKEDCTSDDNLLASDIRNTTDLKQDKIRQFYSIAPVIDDVSNCDDGITLM